MMGFAVVILLSSLHMMSQRRCSTVGRARGAVFRDCRVSRCARDQARRGASGGGVAEGSSDGFLFGLAG